MLTKKAIWAIEQVLTANKDMVELCERRGVTYDNLREVFRLAYNAKENEDLHDHNQRMVDMLKKAECREHGGMGGYEHFGETCWPCVIRSFAFIKKQTKQ